MAASGDSDSAAAPVTLARHAMATRFEIVLHGENHVALRSAGEEALDEIERLEDILSLYRTSTEIAHINACAAHGSVRVSVPVFRLLQHALKLCEETQGAFDITVGPLMQCWGFMGDTGRMPSEEALDAAREKVGWPFVTLDPAEFTVRFGKPGMMIDLGAIGKGYAIDRAVELLREAGVTSALIHGGTSSVYAIGHPPDAPAWKVAVRSQSDGLSVADPHTLPTLTLRDEALSVSAVWGKSFQSGDRRCGHVIDPRTGHPTSEALLATVTLPSTTETDALSTALLTMGREGIAAIRRIRAGARCLVVHEGPQGLVTISWP